MSPGQIHERAAWYAPPFGSRASRRRTNPEIDSGLRHHRLQLATQFRRAPTGCRQLFGAYLLPLADCSSRARSIQRLVLGEPAGMNTRHFSEEYSRMPVVHGFNIFHSPHTPHAIAGLFKQRKLFLERDKSLRRCLGEVRAVRYAEYRQRNWLSGINRLPVLAQQGSCQFHASHVLREDSNMLKRFRAQNPAGDRDTAADRLEANDTTKGSGADCGTDDLRANRQWAEAGSHSSSRAAA